MLSRQTNNPNKMETIQMKNLVHIFLCIMLTFGASAVLAQNGGSGHIPGDIAAELSRGGIYIQPSESCVVTVFAILSVF